MPHGRRFWTVAQKRTAFDWRAYVSRRGALRLLRRARVHVDTLITTQDGFSDTVHWQVITAIFPELIEASQVVQESTTDRDSAHRRRVALPAHINGLIAQKLLDCAYGERVRLEPSILGEFYRIAREYNIKYAMKVCLNHAKRLLDIQNCIQLLMVSLRHRHRRLRRAAYLMIRSNFKLILHVNEDFELLPSNYLKRLLLDDFLKLNEDEEFAWLAIVRWVEQRRLTLRDLIGLYNQMVSSHPATTWCSPRQHRPRATKEYFRYTAGRRSVGGIPQPHPASEPPSTLNFYTQAIPFDWSSPSGNRSPLPPCKPPPSLAKPPLGLDDFSSSSSAERIGELFNLVRCLRFMRFRSLNAFSVILEHQLVRCDDRLKQLVSHMRLVYMVKKKIPLDRVQLELFKPAYLDRLRLNEMQGPKRALRIAKGFVRRSTGPGRGWLNRGRRMMSASEVPSAVEPNPSKLKEEQQQVVDTIVSRDIQELTSECLEWADKPRVPTTVALLIGGWQDGIVSSSLVAYDFICDKWFKLNVRLPEPRAFHASCSRPKTSQIFIFGGTNGELILDSVLRFDPAYDILSKRRVCCSGNSNKCLQQVPRSKLSKNYHKKPTTKHLSYRFHCLRPMNERRCHLSGVFHTDGRLYALGGHNGQQRLRSGEWYDVKANQWHPIADMTIARSDASACSHANKIFIAGGQISDQFIQSSVEFYKPSDNTWTFAAPMIVPRMSFRLVSYRNLLLAIGGTNGLMGGDEVASVTRSVERYNPNLSSWTLCTPMVQKRSSFGAMDIEDNLVVAGGFGGRRRLKTCEALKIGHFTTTTNQHQPPGPVRPPLHLQFRIQPQPPPPNATPTANPPRNTTTQTGQPQNPPQVQRPFSFRGSPSPIRSAMKWVRRADLPARKSGFSIAVVGPLRNARDLTYHGSKRHEGFRGPCVVKQRSRWHRLKIVKRHKLIKHLKIALVVTVVILMM